MSEPRVAYTVATAADACSISQDTIRRAIGSGDLPAHYPTTRPLIMHADLIAWLETSPRQRAS